MPGKKVLEILLSKLRTKYDTVLSKKDPRLAADITWGEIQEHGEQVL